MEPIVMHIRLHKNARTTPVTRAEIAASSDSVATLAQRYHVGQSTIRRWRSRSVFTDASHTAHHLQTALECQDSSDHWPIRSWPLLGAQRVMREVMSTLQ